MTTMRAKEDFLLSPYFRYRAANVTFHIADMAYLTLSGDKEWIAGSHAHSTKS